MHSSAPFKRHATRHRGVTYRSKADGTKSYYVYAQGRQVAVKGGEREALARQAELRSQVAKGERIAPVNVKFGQVGEEWLAGKTKLRSKTRTDYRRALDLVLLPRFGHLKLAQVDANAIAALIRDLEAKGLNAIAPSRPVRPLGASQINNYVTKPLSGMFKHALRRGLLSANPVALLTSDERPGNAERARPFEWSPETITKVVAAARQRGQESTSQYDYSLLIELAFESGLRIGELTGLEWGDVDLELRLLHVQRQFANGEASLFLKTDAARRDVPLRDELVRKLREHKLASPHSFDNDVVFCSNSGGHLLPGNIRRRGWYPALEAAGMPRLKFHQSRHAAASLLIGGGLPVTAVASVLGHADPAVTLRIYAHLWDRRNSHEQVRLAMNVLG
jgi:integrase